jgi:DNA-binding MarR family transcriptional regulator
MEFNRIASFDPSTCIAGKINQTKRLISNIFRKHLSPFGITESQLTLLFILSKKKNMTQKELSNFAFLEKSSLNRNLKRLVERKLLSRDHFPDITITTEGNYFVENIIPVWEKAMSEVKLLIREDGESALNLVHNNLTH